MMESVKKIYYYLNLKDNLFRPLLLSGALALVANVFSFEIMVMSAFVVLILKRNA